ncbi:hypothetical protein ElyMa_003607900 [Elysia marginata]|uniref:Glycine N-acyltransferase-like protein n=1 Tax=Elysia marginata TaxID=1093978 RepID=A0AAV4EQZ5_9GAST|nr:hypothetical protein ElyMa_003607900 [Elysia marginata]
MEPSTLHRVTASELPTLKRWLEKYLPHSFKLHNTVTETLLGRWNGSTFCTLGWPNILAAGEGELNPNCQSYLYHAHPRSTSVFSPNREHLETFLLLPGYLDWTQPMFFQGISTTLRSTIESVARAKGGHCTIKPNIILEAKKEDLPLRDGKCVGLEAGTEEGTLGMLHVRQDARGRGLGTVITSHLAHQYFSAGLPVMVVVGAGNESSLRMHTSCGFKEICRADWIFYNIGDTREFLHEIGYTADVSSVK